MFTTLVGAWAWDQDGVFMILSFQVGAGADFMVHAGDSAGVLAGAGAVVSMVQAGAGVEAFMAQVGAGAVAFTGQVGAMEVVTELVCHIIEDIEVKPD